MAALASVQAAARRLLSRLPAHPRLPALRAAVMGTARTQGDDGPATRVAVQSVEDPVYFALFSAIVDALAQRRPVRAELVVVRGVSGAIGVGWRAWVMRSAVMTWILSSQWVRVYRGLVDHVGYRNVSWSHPIGDTLDWFRSLVIWRRKCREKGDFLLDVRGVPVGDLVVDTFLRFRPSPRFRVTDALVWRLIWQAHRDVRRGQAYFTSRRPAFYLTSYSTYLEHGVAARVALQAGIAVFSFGNLVLFGKQLSLADWYHTPDCSQYRTKFEALDDPAPRLARAAELLGLRLSGGVDPATSYMRQSAYASTSDPAPAGMAGAVVVFLHDFFDSPHVYGDLVFEDFWQWICFTIETLQAAGIRHYLKPHPNQIAQNGEVLQDLQRAYPHVPLISQGVTNAQLAQAGMGCGVTVYGTVAHELAFLGIPSIGCARHPHHAFDFCRTAKNREQYARYLTQALAPVVDRESLRTQALQFYYMHNLHGGPDELALRADFLAFWKACVGLDSTDGEVLQALEAMRLSAGFQAFVAKLP
jgi:hypothetical protein